MNFTKASFSVKKLLSNPQVKHGTYDIAFSYKHDITNIFGKAQTQMHTYTHTHTHTLR